MRRTSRLLLLAAFCTISGQSTAIAVPQPWLLEAPQMADKTGQARLTIRVNAALEELRLELTRAEGKTAIQRTWKRPAIGQTLTIRWMVPSGRSRWRARCDGTFSDGRQFSNFDFDVVSVPDLDVRIDRKDLDLAHGHIFVHSNQALSKAEVQWFDQDGTETQVFEHLLQGQSGKIRVPLGAIPTSAIQRIEVKLYDAVQRWRSFRLVSWYVEIPHDDVNFETNSAKLHQNEAKKIDAVTARIEDEVKRFRKALGASNAQFERLNLFVAGCTDTVGSEVENLKLSRARAKTIAHYFASKKISATIFFEGFGEGLLAIPTADNVAEERNRRALYILSNVQPSGLLRPGRKWHRL
ncbi:MAG: OmpA family protein [Myxococcota bacterium]|nr:OmpA family protein [Myxococcota bacterium]